MYIHILMCMCIYIYIYICVCALRLPGRRNLAAVEGGCLGSWEEYYMKQLSHTYTYVYIYICIHTYNVKH